MRELIYRLKILFGFALFFFIIGFSNGWAQGEVLGQEQALATVNKEILNPATATYHDSLSESDFLFLPKDSTGEIIKTIPIFRITLNNPSRRVIRNVKLTDEFPRYQEMGTRLVDFLSGVGRWDEQNGLLTIEIGDLNPGDSRQFIIRVQTVDKRNLPVSSRNICVENRAIVTAEDMDSSQIQDSTQFCMQAQTGQITSGADVKADELPQAGVTDVLAITAYLPFLGYILRKKSYRLLIRNLSLL